MRARTLPGRRACGASGVSAPRRAHALVVLVHDAGELIRRLARESVEVEREGAPVVVGAEDGAGSEDRVTLVARGEREPEPRAGSGQLAAEVADEHAALA